MKDSHLSLKHRAPNPLLLECQIPEFGSNAQVKSKGNAVCISLGEKDADN